MAPVPTIKECKELYKEYGTPYRVILHCREVSRVSSLIAERLNDKGYSLNVDLVKAAGLLHDLMRTCDEHDSKAGEILESRGYHEIAELVKDHMSYKFGKPGDITEHDILCLGDRVVKEHAYVGIDDRVDYLINKDPENDERKERLEYWRERVREYIRSIEEIMGITLDDLIRPGIDDLLTGLERPGRYTGGEYNEIVKDISEVELRMAFCFPDLYEIGMSYLGMQILYDVVNRNDDIFMERAFEPAKDMAAKLRNEGRSLFTLETKSPLNTLDVVGFTLQYEMSYTTIVDMLELSSIPIHSKDRTEEDPLIIAGGPCAFNPEPLSDFIDVFLIGDGEQLLPDFLHSYLDSKKSLISKQVFLKSAEELDGVYVPSLYTPRYAKNELLSDYLASFDHLPIKIKRSVLSDLDEAPFPVKPLVPNIECVHDRACVESFRGCTRGCRFCQAGMIYRPVRERNSDTIFRHAKEQIHNTGSDEISLLSLSSSDHSDFEKMATRLVEYTRDNNVSLSLPSLRLDSFSFKVLSEIEKYKKSGLTFAVEAGTQRLRDSINKGITEKDVYEAIESAVELGWRRVKLYFMIGLPGETKEDLDGIVEITKEIVKIFRDGIKRGSFSVSLGISNFVPKPFTPFQWSAQDSEEMFEDKKKYLMEGLKIKGVKFSFHDIFVSKIEAVLARGDRRVSELIEIAHRKGAVLDGWSEYFDKDIWKESLKEFSYDYRSYSDRERSNDETFPWEIIDCGIERSYLASEYERSKKNEVTKDCRLGCNNCGINKMTKCFAGVKSNG